MEAIAAHEKELTRYAMQALSDEKGITISDIPFEIGLGDNKLIFSER